VAQTQKAVRVIPSIAGVIGSLLAITGVVQGNVHLAFVGIGIGMATSLAFF
jgi:hypothetical protein